MQVVSLDSARRTELQTPGGVRAQPVPGVAAPRVAAVSPAHAARDATVAAGASSLPASLNQEISAAQCGERDAVQLGARLEELRLLLARYVSGESESAPVQARLRQVQAEWRERTPEAGWGGQTLSAQSWQVHDVASGRKTLRQVTRAIESLGAARTEFRKRLADIVATLATSPEQAQSAHENARVLQAMATRTGYNSFSTVAPALAGVSRERVLQLLDPRS
jgi:hypothetical protein